ncbi:hypothetical protein NDU88_001742 [Pleurodeles waltl]|uniref:Uncharacterized protein n=1 Tax=Pleurodeles waltl TaxID=8319 RepID=A0AAV7SD20_PLEWA|nr:hypothetical protein NDU88_001742 [Pleurodeles waltl]
MCLYACTGYDAELQLAVDALQQILQVQDSPSTMSQDTAYAGPPAGQATPGVATQKVDGKVKNTVRRRKTPASNDGPLIKNGPSRRETPGEFLETLEPDEYNP